MIKGNHINHSFISMQRMFCIGLNHFLESKYYLFFQSLETGVIIDYRRFDELKLINAASSEKQVIATLKKLIQLLKHG